MITLGSKINVKIKNNISAEDDLKIIEEEFT